MCQKIGEAFLFSVFVNLLLTRPNKMYSCLRVSFVCVWCLRRSDDRCYWWLSTKGRSPFITPTKLTKKLKGQKVKLNKSSFWAIRHPLGRRYDPINYMSKYLTNWNRDFKDGLNFAAVFVLAVVWCIFVCVCWSFDMSAVNDVWILLCQMTRT